MPAVPLRIVIWDNDAARIAEIDRNLHLSARGIGLKIAVNSNSEPPALAREQFLNRVPVIEIEGRFWSKTPGKTLSEADCLNLLQRFADWSQFFRKI